MAVIKQVLCRDGFQRGTVKVFIGSELVFEDRCQAPEDNTYDRDHADVSDLLLDLLKRIAGMAVDDPQSLEFVFEEVCCE